MSRLVLFALLTACSRDRVEVRPEPAPPRATVEAPVPVPIPPKPPEPAPPPPPPPPPPPKFDNAAARASLASIAYKKCGLDRSARVLVRFHPEGHATVDRIATEDALPSDVELCLTKAFERAHVPPFDGPPVSVAFLVR